MKNSDATQTSFKQACYSVYQPNWMLEHGISLQNLFDRLQLCTINAVGLSLTAPAGQNNVTFISDCLENGKELLLETGLDDEDIWLTYDEFIQHQFLDTDYMIGLISKLPSAQRKNMLSQYEDFLRDIKLAC